MEAREGHLVSRWPAASRSQLQAGLVVANYSCTKESPFLLTPDFPRTCVRTLLCHAILLCCIWRVPAPAQADEDAKNTEHSAVSVTASRSHEDLSSLSITGTGLEAGPQVAGEKTETPEFTRELIQVQWRNGDPIDLYLIRPHGVSKPRPILYLYSYPTETTRFQDNQYCARVTSGGFAAVGFVSAMTGHRYHDRPMKEWFVSELPEALATSVHDVQMVLNYLSQRGDFDLREVGVFGQGSGATIAILSAAVDSRIRVLDLLDPWGDWPDWLEKSSLVPEAERSTYLKPEFLTEVAPLDPVKWLPQLRTQLIRIQTVADNATTPSVARQRILASAPSSAQVVQFATTRELYASTGGGRLFDWAKDQISLLGKPANAAVLDPRAKKADAGKAIQ